MTTRPAERAATARKTTTSAASERRRHPRREICAPVTVCCGEELIEGYSENLSYTGVLIQSLSGMPGVGDACELSILMDDGAVEARGRVVRANLRERTFAVDLEHVDVNGHLLLAALVS